jgi:hypothetical protein
MLDTRAESYLGYRPTVLLNSIQSANFTQADHFARSMKEATLWIWKLFNWWSAGSANSVPSCLFGGGDYGDH